jgi:HK97 family phage portal protein
MTMNFLMRGNAYARLVRNEAGEVIEMWPLSSDQVEVEVLKDRSIVYKYSYEGQIAVYNEGSILHWRDKGNGVIGMSRLDYMRSSVGLAIDAQNHSRNTFRKSGKRPGVFMIDKLLTKEQRDAIRANYSGLIEGSEDDLLVLEAGAKFEALSMSPVDLQMMETRRFSVEDIARWFGIPSVMINDTAKTTTWGTGIEQIIEGFYKFRLRPMLEGLEQAVERRVLTVRQRQLYTVEFSLEAILRGSYIQRLDAGSKAVQNGLITRNEWRQLENLPPIEGGDDLTVQVNLAPIGMLGQPTESEERSAKIIEMLSKSQKNVESALQAMLSREQKPINLAINPSIDVQTPEIKMDLQITNEKTVTKKHLSLVRDENGKVLGAESIEE